MVEAGCGYGTRGVAGWGAQCIISSGSGGGLRSRAARCQAAARAREVQVVAY
eukprot:COSAG05_NODE_2105_length_3552_cov_3.767738_8_plen_52_part_00